MTKEECIARMDEIDSEIKELTKEKERIGKILIQEHCPYKVGQKARYIRVTEKNVGTFFNPKYEVTSRKEEILVCVNIRNAEWSNEKFRCEFKRLRPNGELTSNFVHVPKREIEWLDEYYELNKK